MSGARVVPLMPPAGGRRAIAQRNAPSLDAPLPTELGPVMEASEIAADPEFGAGKVSARWVLTTVAPAEKWYMGRIAVWYRAHVERWWWEYHQRQRRREIVKARAGGAP